MLFSMPRILKLIRRKLKKIILRMSISIKNDAGESS